MKIINEYIRSHKNITTNKGPYLGDEGWNNWMINRYLSMDQDYVEVVNITEISIRVEKV